MPARSCSGPREVGIGSARCEEDETTWTVLSWGENTAVISAEPSRTRNPSMPLLDHFHPPVSERRRWEGFHGLWAAALVEKLNQEVLADEYFADMQVHVGSPVEVDVATLEETSG